MSVEGSDPFPLRMFIFRMKPQNVKFHFDAIAIAKFPFAAICTDIYVNAVNTVNVGDYLVNTRYPLENIPNVLCCVRNRMYAADALIGMDFER